MLLQYNRKVKRFKSYKGHSSTQTVILNLFSLNKENNFEPKNFELCNFELCIPPLIKYIFKYKWLKNYIFKLPQPIQIIIKSKFDVITLTIFHNFDNEIALRISSDA